jgi:fatty-acyl-CoA synthase
MSTRSPCCGANFAENLKKKGYTGLSDNPNERSPGLAYFKGDKSDPIAEGTVGDALRLAAETWGARDALIDGSPSPPRRWGFDALLREAEKIAGVLLGHFQVGDHVAVWAPNCPEWALLEFAAAFAGLTLVTVNPAYLEVELEYVLTQSRAIGLFTVREYRGRDLISVAEKVRRQIPSLRHVFVLGDWSQEGDGGATKRELPRVSPDDPAQIQYTSGTTGFPKGALLTHRGLSNNARFFARQIGAAVGDVWINPMPMFHTAGCGLVTLGALQTGGRTTGDSKATILSSTSLASRTRMAIIMSTMIGNKV